MSAPPGADLGRGWTEWLYDHLPASWHVPPLRPSWIPAVAAAPGWSVDYRMVIGGKWPQPEGVVLYGRVQPVHPLSLALWKAAMAAPGFLLVARTPGLGNGATGERPDEVRRFDPATPEVALEWIDREARRIHEETRPGVPYVPGKEHRARLRAEQEAKVVRAAQEAEERRRAEELAKAQVAKQQTAFTVRRGHRVPVKP